MRDAHSKHRSEIFSVTILFCVSLNSTGLSQKKLTKEGNERFFV